MKVQTFIIENLSECVNMLTKGFLNNSNGSPLKMRSTIGLVMNKVVSFAGRCGRKVSNRPCAESYKAW